jgi:hypothetical protein
MLKLKRAVDRDNQNKIEYIRNMRQISNNLSQSNLGEGLMPNNIHKSV